MMEELSLQRRFEDAQATRDAIDHLEHLRRAYRALERALHLRAAVLFPVAGDTPSVRLNLVWRGRLEAVSTLTAGTASLEIGRLLRSLPMNGHHAPHPATNTLSVPQRELDGLLAVRRWFLENPDAVTVDFPEGRDLEAGLDAWRELLLEKLWLLLPR